MKAPTQRIITRKFLLETGACLKQVDIFSKEWPDGAEVTLPNLLRAGKLSLDVHWLADKVLSPEAEKLYQESVAPAFLAAFKMSGAL